MKPPSTEQMAALNARIAELMGLPRFETLWRYTYGPGVTSAGWKSRDSALVDRQTNRQWHFVSDVDSYENPVPAGNFTGSLDAVHEAERALMTTGSLRGRFQDMLSSVAYDRDMQAGAFYLVSSKAWQRVVAIDRTLSETPIL